MDALQNFLGTVTIRSVYLFGIINMKKIILALILSVMTSVTFAGPYYLGTDLGYSNTHYNGDALGANDDTTGFGARLFGGYQFSEYFASELGWTHFAAAKGNRVSSLYEHAYDLSVVGHYPLRDSGLSIFAKLGLAYIQAEKNYVGQGHTYANLIRPTYGVGVASALTPHWSVDMQLSRIQGKSSAYTGFDSSSNLPNADLYTVGAIYRFS